MMWIYGFDCSSYNSNGYHSVVAIVVTMVINSDSTTVVVATVALAAL